MEMENGGGMLKGGKFVEMKIGKMKGKRIVRIGGEKLSGWRVEGSGMMG